MLQEKGGETATALTTLEVRAAHHKTALLAVALESWTLRRGRRSWPARFSLLTPSREGAYLGNDSRAQLREAAPNVCKTILGALWALPSEQVLHSLTADGFVEGVEDDCTLLDMLIHGIRQLTDISVFLTCRRIHHLLAQVASSS